jgi:hypothetical protein
MKLYGLFLTQPGCTGAWYVGYDYGVPSNYIGLPIKQQASSAYSGTINCSGIAATAHGAAPPQSAAFIAQGSTQVSASLLGGLIR